MRQKIKTIPNLAAGSPQHQSVHDKSNLRDWEKNVVDNFKGQTDEEIRMALRATANPFAVAFEQWIGDFNMATGIRCANAFNAQEVFYVGNKKWDRRGAVGVYNYTPVTWMETVDEFAKLKEKYVFVGIDNIAGSVPLSTYRFRPNTLLIFGEEGLGLTPGMQALCSDLVAIEQYGSVRSLNCGVASGIIMHEFVRQMKEIK